MKRILIFIIMLMCLTAAKPKGNLVYCSCARYGAAGIGSDYCELFADAGQAPKVVVVLNKDNRFGDPVIRREFPIEQSTVDSLALMLMQRKVYRLNGYRLEEPICGGSSYRIHMEYDSGDQVTAYWYGQKVKEKALEAYDAIERFFSPWRERATTEEQ